MDDSAPSARADDFELAIAGDGAETIVAVRGELDAYTAGRLDDELRHLVDTGHLSIVLDLRETEFIDSTGLRVLVQYFKQLRGNGGAFAVSEPTKPIRKVLDIAGLSRILEIREAARLDAGEADSV